MNNKQTILNMDKSFIQQALKDMVSSKLDNMIHSEISDDVFSFLQGKETIVAAKAFELFERNECVNSKCFARDDLTLELILDWSVYKDLYDIPLELDSATDEEVITYLKNIPKFRDDVTYDCLYNFDALWMTAIHQAFPEKTTDTKCGYGMIEFNDTEKEEEYEPLGFY